MVLKTLMKSIREYKASSILAPVLTVAEVVLECLITYFMADLINEIQAGCEYVVILKYGGLLIGLAMLSLLFGIISGIVAAKAATGFAKNLRKDMFYAIQNFSFSDVDKFSNSSLVTRMTTDITNVQMAYGMIIRIAVRAPLLIIVSFVLSFIRNAQMSIIFVAIVPFLIIALGLIMWKALPLFNRIFKKYDALNESVQENVNGIRVVKSFVREEYEQEKFDKAATEVKKDFTKAEKLVALSSPTMMFCIYLSMTLLSFFGAKLIISTGGVVINTGDLSSLIGYGVQILMAFMMIAMIFVMITMSIESSKRIAEVLQTVSDLKNKEDGIQKVKNGDIEFKNVSFKYSKKAEKYALENINLTIQSGQTIGVIGGTGSSKSTLIQLIPRLYDASEGEVLVGGEDVKNYDLQALRNAVSVVLQKNVLFSGTIKENLRWGNEKATDEQIEKACKLAQADSFVESFPEKYDTFIEQGGTNVSGGQKQRLCIARALLKEPKILILDDSTSAVDTKTDALIRKAFEEEIPNTTKIIIAQRISSVENSDKIIVLDGGKINGIGTHSELLKTNKIYQEVYYSQTKTKAEEGGRV